MFYFETRNDEIFHGSVSLPEGLIRVSTKSMPSGPDSHGVTTKAFFSIPVPEDLDQPSCPYYLGRWERNFPSWRAKCITKFVGWLNQPNLNKNVGQNGCIFPNFRSEN